MKTFSMWLYDQTKHNAVMHYALCAYEAKSLSELLSKELTPGQYLWLASREGTLEKKDRVQFCLFCTDQVADIMPRSGKKALQALKDTLAASTGPLSDDMYDALMRKAHKVYASENGNVGLLVDAAAHALYTVLYTDTGHHMFICSIKTATASEDKNEAQRKQMEWLKTNATFKEIKNE